MNSKVKITKCKICKNEFKQYNSTHIVCGYECSIDLIKQKNSKKEKQEKQEKQNWNLRKKKWKEENETIPELIKKVEKEFNLFIRHRDEFKECVSCLKPLGSIKEFHAGHFYSAGHFSIIRFNEKNVHGQCVECNTHLSGNGNKYRLNITKRISQQELDELDNIAHNRHKWNREELLKLFKIYKLKNKITEMEKKSK